MTDVIDNGSFEVNPDVQHHDLQGLADDDHTQYALLSGRGSGQMLYGGTVYGDQLVLRSDADVLDPRPAEIVLGRGDSDAVQIYGGIDDGEALSVIITSGSPTKSLLRVSADDCLTVERSTSDSAIATFSNSANANGLSIVVSDESLTAGHAAPIGSIGTSGNEAQVKYGAGDSDWGYTAYGKYDGDNSVYYQQFGDGEDSAHSLLRFYKSTGYVGFSAPAKVFENSTWVLPAVTGLAGEVLGQSSSAGTLDWQGQSKWYAYLGYKHSYSPLVYGGNDYNADTTGAPLYCQFADSPKGVIQEWKNTASSPLLDENYDGTQNGGVACYTSTSGYMSTIYFVSDEFADSAALAAWIDGLHPDAPVTIDYFQKDFFIKPGATLDYVCDNPDGVAYVSGAVDPATLLVQKENWLSINSDQTVRLLGSEMARAGLYFYEAQANGTNYCAIQAPTSIATSFTLTLPTTDGNANEVLKTDGSGVLSWTDHGGIGGLSDDDHSQYALLAGRAGGQALTGGTGPGDALTLRGSSSGTGVSGMVVVRDNCQPYADAAYDLGFYTMVGTSYRWRHLNISGNISDGTNTVTAANMKTAYDHSQIGNVSPHVPTGSIFMWGTGTAPTGYLLCDGSAVNQTTYAALYAVIGYTFGNPGGGNFNLPNMGINFPKGYKSGTNTVGSTGGSATHTHSFTGNALATHQHAAISAGTPAGSIGATASAAVGSASPPSAGTDNRHTHAFTGSALAAHQHNAITAGTPSGSVSTDNGEPAYLVLAFIIKT